MYRWLIVSTPDGTIANHVVMTLVQKRGVRFKVDGMDVSVDEEGFFVPDKTLSSQWGDNSMIFGGGCSLIFDLDQLRLRYVIKKDIDDRQRMISSSVLSEVGWTIRTRPISVRSR